MYDPPTIVIPDIKILQLLVVLRINVYVPAKYKLPQEVIVPGNSGNAPPT